MSEMKEAGMIERLITVAVAADDQDCWTITRRDAGKIVRAILNELREPTEAMLTAAASSLAKPRMHVGHRGSDAVVGAGIAYRAMLDAALAEDPPHAQ